MSKWIRALLVFAMLASLPAACALLSKGDQGAARYFTLETASTRSDAAPAVAPGTQGVPAALRLGRVTGATHLEERLVFRGAGSEINYHRELRWTAPPEVSLQRMLTRVLFEERRIRHLVGGAGATLDVQLTALDEILSPQHFTRVQIVARLHDEHLVIWEGTITVDRPVVDRGGGDPALAAVEALGTALQAAVDRVADHVVLKLAERR